MGAVGLQLYLETRGRRRVWRGYLEEPSAGVEVEGGMEALAGVDNQPVPPLLAPKLNTVFQNLPPQPLTPQLLCNAHLPQLKHPIILGAHEAEGRHNLLSDQPENNVPPLIDHMLLATLELLQIMLFNFKQVLQPLKIESNKLFFELFRELPEYHLVSHDTGLKTPVLQARRGHYMNLQLFPEVLIGDIAL